MSALGLLAIVAIAAGLTVYLLGPSAPESDALGSATLVVHKDFVPDNGLGTVTASVTCTAGGVASPASGTVTESTPRSFTITGFTLGATCTATEGAAPAGYTSNELNCLLVPIVINVTSDCTITNTQNTATFTVNKDFVPDNALGLVAVTVTCTDGGIAVPPAGAATEALPFTTTVIAFTAGATCTATEEVAPAGYTANEMACQNVAISVSGSSNCTITNTQNTATFTVNKDFVPDNSLGVVSVTVTCTNGGIAAPPAGVATEALPFTTTIIAFTAGATCTASEGVAPAGYTANETACQNVAISVSGSSNCTITNTQNTATFTVNKDFVPDNALGAVAVTVTCTDGGIAIPPVAIATEALPASFTVLGYTGDPTCTATETPIPVGYSSTGECSALLAVSTCTITNTLRSATLSVHKDFLPDSSTPVTIAVICTSGIPSPLMGTATEGSPFVTTITGFSTGATCIATEVPLAGYTPDELACAVVPITEGGAATCTIVNVRIIPTCPNVAPPWPVPPGDADCDGFPDTVGIGPPGALAAETSIGTNPLLHCSLTPLRNDEGIDAWPVDADDNQMVNGSDLLMFAPSFWGIAPNAPYDPRYDLNGDGRVNGSDLLKAAPFFFKNCL